VPRRFRPTRLVGGKASRQTLGGLLQLFGVDGVWEGRVVMATRFRGCFTKSCMGVSSLYAQLRGNITGCV